MEQSVKEVLEREREMIDQAQEAMEEAEMGCRKPLTVDPRLHSCIHESRQFEFFHECQLPLCGRCDRFRPHH